MDRHNPPLRPGQLPAEMRRRAPFQPASEAQKATYIRRLKAGDKPSECRKKAGMTYELFKHALASDARFRAGIQDVDQEFVDRIQDAAYVMALRGDGAMMRWILENERPEKFGKKAHQVQVSHRFESIEDLKRLSDEDIMAEFELLGVEVPD